MQSSWMIGDVKVTQVTELAVEVGELDGLIAEATPDAVRGITWLYPDYANEQGQTLWSVHSFVVDTGSKVVLVDTCCGYGKDLPLISNWGNLNTPYLQRLADAGYRPEQIDYVVATHLHLDHVGWNTVERNGTWEPTFPNARYTFVRDEFEYHRSLAEGATVTEDLDHAVVYAGTDPDIHQQTRLVFAKSIQPCVDAGLVDLVPVDHTICAGVRYTSTPGHTKSHHSLTIESRGSTGFITGDFIHHPIHAARPTWSSRETGTVGCPPSAASSRSTRSPTVKSCCSARTSPAAASAGFAATAMPSNSLPSRAFHLPSHASERVPGSVHVAGRHPLLLVEY